MGTVTCIKCNKITRHVNSGRNYATICPGCATELGQQMSPEDRLAHAKVGMDALIDEATGFTKLRPKDDLQKRLAIYKGESKCKNR